jgi:hypothetical protein
MHFRVRGNNFERHDLVRHQSMDATQDYVMMSRINDSGESIDRKTSQSICNAVGERLQQNLRPHASQLTPRLQQLMEELYRQDREQRQEPN